MNIIRPTAGNPSYEKRTAMTHSKKNWKNARLRQLLVSFSTQCLYWKRRIIIV